MKLLEYKNEEALDILADIIEPASAIFADKVVKEAFEKDGKITAIKTAIKSHKSEIIEILARLDNVPVDKYNCNIFTLPTRLLEIINDANLMSFFDTQRQTEENPASVAVMGNTTGTGEM